MSFLKRSLLGTTLVAVSAVLLNPSNAWTGPPDGQKKSGERKLAESLSKHLKPWHPFQEEWAEKATLVVLGTYKEQTGDWIEYIYLMNLYDQHEVPRDQIVTRVVLEARPDTRLVSARVVHLWLTVDRSESFTSYSCGDMTPATLEKYGLENVTREYPES